jgi:hypothetical protein
LRAPVQRHIERLSMFSSSRPATCWCWLHSGHGLCAVVGRMMSAGVGCTHRADDQQCTCPQVVDGGMAAGWWAWFVCSTRHGYINC